MLHISPSPIHHHEPVLSSDSSSLHPRHEAAVPMPRPQDAGVDPVLRSAPPRLQRRVFLHGIPSLLFWNQKEIKEEMKKKTRAREKPEKTRERKDPARAGQARKEKKRSGPPSPMTQTHCKPNPIWAPIQSKAQLKWAPITSKDGFD